jgi:phosphatidylinositol alpha-1,6-mannosyltransferase
MGNVDALMVTSSFLPGRGGIESYLAELCAELSPRVAVLAPAKRDGRAIPADLGYEVAGYDGSMLFPSKHVARAVVARARELGTDRILFGTPWPLVLLGPRLRAEGLRYSVIVHGAEMLVPSVAPVVKSRLARAFSMSDLLLPVSEFTGSRLRSFLISHQLEVPEIEVLRARVDLERFRPEAATAQTRSRLGLGDGPLLLCFGRLVKRKGVDRAIDAVTYLAREEARIQLAIAGTGPKMRSLRKLARRSNAPAVFLGRVSDDDAPALYATADVFLLPVVDRYRGLEVEGLGVVLLEAAACGTPGVTGRSGGTPEAVVDGETGFVVDASDRGQLVDAARRLIRDDELRKTMGKVARTHVENHFSHDRLPAGFLAWLGGVG